MALLQSIRQNLNDGKFRFVVLMDRLEDRLRDLITFVNQNSRFDIFGVELEFYKFQEYEILIPKIHGAEVKKEVGAAKPTGQKKSWDERSFFEEAEKHLSADAVKSLRELYSFSTNIARVTWGSGTFQVRFDHINRNSLYSVDTRGLLWLNFKDLTGNDDSIAVAERLGEELRHLDGFKIPEDFRRRYITVRTENWSPQVETFMKIIKAVLKPNQDI